MNRNTNELTSESLNSESSNRIRSLRNSNFLGVNPRIPFVELPIKKSINKKSKKIKIKKRSKNNNSIPSSSIQKYKSESKIIDNKSVSKNVLVEQEKSIKELWKSRNNPSDYNSIPYAISMALEENKLLLKSIKECMEKGRIKSASLYSKRVENNIKDILYVISKSEIKDKDE